MQLTLKLSLVVIFIFVIMRLVLVAIYGLEYLDNFIQVLGINYMVLVGVNESSSLGPKAHSFFLSSSKSHHRGFM